MFRRNKQKIGFIIIFIFTALLSLLWLKEAENLGNQYRAISVRLTNNGVTRQEIVNARSQESSRGSSYLPEITAWKQGEKTNIQNEELNRSVELVPIMVYGDMDLTAPMALICGNLVYSGDRKGCVIDSKTAYQLFGVEKAVGNRITYQNKIYDIRGVVKTEPSVLLIQGDDKVEYFNLELLYEEPERGEELSGDFLYQNGLSTEYFLIDGYFLSRTNITFLTLPLWLFFFIASFILIRQLIQMKASRNRKQFYLYSILMILFIFICSLLLIDATGNPICIPKKLLPSKWSDFDFWTLQYARVREQVLQMRYLPPCRKDIFLTEELIRLPYKFAVLSLLSIWVSISGFELTKSAICSPNKQ